MITGRGCKKYFGIIIYQDIFYFSHNISLLKEANT